MTLSDKRRGYAQIKAASLLARDSEAWGPFMQDILKLPLSMLPGVQYAVNRKAWRLATDPIMQVRDAAERVMQRALSDTLLVTRDDKTSVGDGHDRQKQGAVGGIDRLDNR